VAETEVTHTALVLAQWLDNDEDGVPDDVRVLRNLMEVGAAMVVVGGGAGGGLDRRWLYVVNGNGEKHPMVSTSNSNTNRLRLSCCNDFPLRQDVDAKADISLYWHHINKLGLHDENINNDSDGDTAATVPFDRTLEQTFHLISEYGWGEVYPEDFSCRPSSLAIGGIESVESDFESSTVMDAMDRARGGKWGKEEQMKKLDLLLEHELDIDADYDEFDNEEGLNNEEEGALSKLFHKFNFPNVWPLIKGIPPTIPPRGQYPKEAWFTYDDYFVCDYTCMCNEFLYRATITALSGVSVGRNLGMVGDSSWKVDGADDLRKKDGVLFDLLWDERRGGRRLASAVQPNVFQKNQQTGATFSIKSYDPRGSSKTTVKSAKKEKESSMSTKKPGPVKYKGFPKKLPDLVYRGRTAAHLPFGVFALDVMDYGKLNSDWDKPMYSPSWNGEKDLGVKLNSAEDYDLHSNTNAGVSDNNMQSCGVRSSFQDLAASEEVDSSSKSNIDNKKLNTSINVPNLSSEAAVNTNKQKVQAATSEVLHHYHHHHLNQATVIEKHGSTSLSQLDKVYNQHYYLYKFLYFLITFQNFLFFVLCFLLFLLGYYTVSRSYAHGVTPTVAAREFLDAVFSVGRNTGSGFGRTLGMWGARMADRTEPFLLLNTGERNLVELMPPTMIGSRNVNTSSTSYRVEYTSRQTVDVVAYTPVNVRDEDESSETCSNQNNFGLKGSDYTMKDAE